MNTQKQKNLEKLIFDSLDKEIEGTDIYNHNGSMWVIFTDEKKWVVEYTKERTLWYNYSLFNSIMMLFGMDNNETAEYVKTWFENIFLFKPKVEEINHVDVMKFFNNKMDDTIQNGVSVTSWVHPTANHSNQVDDIIQNGVKRTALVTDGRMSGIEDTIQNGVKQTELSKRDFFPEDILQNGIKDTKSMCGKRGGRVGNTIQNGVKYMMSGSEFKNNQVDDIIKDGVKTTKMSMSVNYFTVKDTIQNGVKNSEGVDFNEDFDDVIQNGVKQ